jgi:N-carbamoylputrescine amidase
MGHTTVTIGLIQMEIGPNRDENLNHALLKAEAAAQGGAQIICLPELFRTQYFCQSENDRNFKLAEPIPGPTTEAFAKLAKRLRVVVVASLFEKRAAGVYHNSAAVIDADGSLLGIYRKMHIPDDPLYYEKFYFTPGDLGFCAVADGHHDDDGRHADDEAQHSEKRAHLVERQPFHRNPKGSQETHPTLPSV